MRIEAKSFAKVNPYLRIEGIKEDGYHLLDISYLSVNLADRLVFTERREAGISVSTDADIPEQENLCYRVGNRLREACAPDSGVRIELTKEIPIGGGLGGGSSNAATTLICLNRLWNCGLNRRELIELGREFGADIPFFFYGGYCRGRGEGYQDLERKENVFQNRLVPILTFPFSQLTAEVYRRYDELERSGGLPDNPRFDTVEGNGSKLRIVNDLQRPAIDLNPEIERYLGILEESSDVRAAAVSGSGSSVFGISRTGVSAEELRRDLSGRLESLPGEAGLTLTVPTNVGQFVRERG